MPIRSVRPPAPEAPAAPPYAPPAPRPERRVLVNDIHSQLNPTYVDRVERIETVGALQGAVAAAAREGKPVCVAGGWHAMGGQQFAGDAVLIDTRELARVRSFDTTRGLVEVEAGIQWPALIEYLSAAQEGRAPAGRPPWAIRQKQTGADRLSIGGAVSANIHGRGLSMRPFIDDVESLRLVDASGRLLRCSRTENAELFRLVFGGYGLFGAIASVTLRLSPRRTLRRQVEILDVERVIDVLARRIAEGHLYGDFQFRIDNESPEFLRQGILSTYHPVDDGTPIPEGQRQLSEDDWQELLVHAHADKRRAWERYSQHYLATSGQLYHSDTHQLSVYLDDYHASLDRKLGARHRASEVITELYVPRGALADFMAEVRQDFRRNAVSVIYGTIRLIERDEESFLPWAKHRYACVIFNLHTEHTEPGLAHSADTFRRLIDMAARRGGSYYLTYHRHARREQVLACYPQFPAFLSAKRHYDPAERFQSEWYRHYAAMFGRE